MKVKVTHKECFPRQTVRVLKEVGKLTLHASLCAQFLLHVLCCFIWGASHTRPILFSVGSFSYTPLAVLCGEFLLHASTVLYGEFLLHAQWHFRCVSLTRSLLFYVGSFTYTPLLFYMGSFSYTPHAVLCGEFLLHAPAVLDREFLVHATTVLWGEFLLYAPWCFMWGVSLTLPVVFYVGSFSYMSGGVLCGEFLLHAPCCFMWGFSLTHHLLFYVGSFSYTPLAVLYSGVSLRCPLLFYVRSFSYMPRAVLCGEFLTLPMLFYVGSFSYTPFAVLCWEFLLHALFCLMWGVTHPRLFSVWRFSCKLLTFVTRRLTNQCKNRVCWVKSVYCASDQANEPNGTACAISWCWHLPLTDAAGLDTPRYRQTEAQSQHNQCPYTISHWIWFHFTCVLLFPSQFYIQF